MQSQIICDRHPSWLFLALLLPRYLLLGPFRDWTGAVSPPHTAPSIMLPSGERGERRESRVRGRHMSLPPGSKRAPVLT